MRSSLRQRRPNHLLDALGAGGEHDEAVEAEGAARSRRHVGECREEILVKRIAIAVDALLLVHLRLEAAALLGCVGELAEAVRQLDAAAIELEALGNARVALLGAGECGLASADIR